MKKLFFYLSILLSFSLMANIYAESRLAPADIKDALGNAQNNNEFKELDANGDNGISFDEYIQGQERKEKKRAEKEINKIILQCDKNKDGAITADELPEEDAMLASMENFEGGRVDFEKHCMFPKEAMEFLDENGDNSVSREELLGTMTSGRRPSKKVENKQKTKQLKREAKRREKLFTSCDTNSDLLLTLREAFSMKCSLSLFTEQFDAYDTNFDSFLSVEEVAAEVKPVNFKSPIDPAVIKSRKKMPPLARLEMSMFDCDADEDGRLGKNETIKEGCEQDMTYFDRIDKNQDGYVSYEEIERMRKKKGFDRMDKDKDGLLDQSEFKKRYN